MISAYYFRAHTYTIVPRHVREDMEWMRDAGTDAVVIGVLEQDLTSAVENYDIICAEAARAGLKVLAVPGRWGNFVAGSPKVPSLFCAMNPQALALKPDGTPHRNQFGPVASVHHPATFEFFCRALETLLRQHPIDGIIWDEPKILKLADHSPAAQTALEGQDLDDPMVAAAAAAGFFDRVGAEALRMKPGLQLAMFVFGYLRGPVVDLCAGVANLHEFGCDGRPWRASDGGRSDTAGGGGAHKFLCDCGGYFLETARRHRKRGFLLIENHAMDAGDTALMDLRLPEVLALRPDHLLYYYFPRSNSDPDATMAVVRKHLAAFRAGG